MAKKQKGKKEKAKATRLGVAYDAVARRWKRVPLPDREALLDAKPLGKAAPTEAKAPEAKAPEVKPREEKPFTEKVLRMLLAGVLDCVEEVNRHRIVLDMQAQVVAEDVAKTRKICGLGLPSVAKSPVLSFLRSDFSYQILRQAKTSLAEAAENLNDHVGYFTEAYKEASAELGEPVAQEIFSAVHRSYLRGPEKFVPAWRTLLEMVKLAGIEITFPH